MNAVVLIYGIILLSVCIISVMIITCDIKRRNKFIASIKAGDIFILDSDIYKYNRLNNLDEDNPFISPKIKDDAIYYPRYTIIIRDVKINDKGILWAAYSFIENSDDIKNKRKYPLYRELEDLIRNRIKIN